MGLKPRSRFRHRVVASRGGGGSRQDRVHPVDFATWQGTRGRYHRGKYTECTVEVQTCFGVMNPPLNKKTKDSRRDPSPSPTCIRTMNRMHPPLSEHYLAVTLLVKRLTNKGGACYSAMKKNKALRAFQWSSVGVGVGESKTCSRASASSAAPPERKATGYHVVSRNPKCVPHVVILVKFKFCFR